jgi:hypothetical protein
MRLKLSWLRRLLPLIFFATPGSPASLAQSGHPEPPPPPSGAKIKDCNGPPYRSSLTSPLTPALPYDRDGWPDIYFTNAPTVVMAIEKKASPGALYHNNHDGTFTDVTRTSGMSKVCFAMGGAVGDYNNDGWPDIYLTCLGGKHLIQEQRRWDLHRCYGESRCR